MTFILDNNQVSTPQPSQIDQNINIISQSSPVSRESFVIFMLFSVKLKCSEGNKEAKNIDNHNFSFKNFNYKKHLKSSSLFFIYLFQANKSTI